ncbi:hypothetical protein [Alkalihalobacterium elongatum]|uniref:hypothetical protein n=1 Tax=Alkalihalobacterium elongatum TaxID=2675466 RepID=UPI001C1F9B50|nr:hypothetical protein [Alkalihalobacterium elongatum]
MNKRQNLKEIQEQQQVVQNQNKAEQFDNTDTEFSSDENVQDAIAKSHQYEAQKQQPTYQPNKPF